LHRADIQVHQLSEPFLCQLSAHPLPADIGAERLQLRSLLRVKWHALLRRRRPLTTTAQWGVIVFVNKSVGLVVMALHNRVSSLTVSVVLALFSGVDVGHSQGSTFTYEGRLLDGGAPANGSYDLQFALTDAAINGNHLGAAFTSAPVLVSSGLFATTLNFGASVFDGSSRWLEIGVRTNGSTVPYALLSPRQAITATPYAVYANSSATAGVAASLPPGTAVALNGAAITNLSGGSLQPGTVSSRAFDGATLALMGNRQAAPVFPMACPVNVIFEGDSLTAEVPSPFPTNYPSPHWTYPSYLRAVWTNTIGSWSNFGVNGCMLADVTNRLANVLNRRAASNNLMLLWIGANDFIPNGTQAITNATTWGNTFDNYCSNVQSAGIKVAVFTVQDRYYQNSPSRFAFRDEINRRIRTTSFKDFIVDMDFANPDMNPTNNPRTYDGTHANTNGGMWQAQFVDYCVRLATTFGLPQSVAGWQRLINLGAGVVTNGGSPAFGNTTITTTSGEALVVTGGNDMLDLRSSGSCYIYKTAGTFSVPNNTWVDSVDGFDHREQFKVYDGTQFQQVLALYPGTFNVVAVQGRFVGDGGGLTNVTASGLSVPTNGPPADTGTVRGWINVTNGGSVFKVPVYQ